MTVLSILDLAPIKEDGSARQALDESRMLAQLGESLGFNRFWMAEHHNMPGIASSATAVAIAHVAAGTKSIRVGAGGVMLPNHAPLVIAEQFGTLAALHPGRIDLGLGRAPGTDQLTARALRRTLQGDVDRFPNDVVELMGYFGPEKEAQRVRAYPGVGEEVQFWILGSSLYGAQLAAMLGLPFAFASHFAPQALDEALEIYRERFQPSAMLAEPWVMLGFNICAADTQEEAQYLRTSGVQAILRLRMGQPGRLPPPVRDLDAQLSAAERQMVSSFTSCSAVGDVNVVREELGAFIERTGADEIMVSGQIFDWKARMRSFEITAEAAALRPPDAIRPGDPASGA
jgi:luciferase family oxidoreductase group 1